MTGAMVPYGGAGVLRPVGWALLLTALALFGVPALVDGSMLVLLAPVPALGLVAVGVTVLTGRAGLPSLGQAAPYAVGAYTSALLGRAGLDTGPLQAAAAALAAALFALLTGPVVARTRGVTALMTTLALGELTATAAARWSTLTGGSDGLAGIPPVRLPWDAAPLTGDTDVFRYAVAVAACAVTATVLALRSPVGLLLAGCRDHEARMLADGHRVGRVLVGAQVWAGALAGLGGHLLVAVQRYVSPADVGFTTSSLALLAAVLGGAASPLGALAGAALVLTTRDQLAAPWPGHGPLLLGGLFVAAVYLLPRGLAGVRPPRLPHPRRPAAAGRPPRPNPPEAGP
ncbi:branched-chain amino acid ABC transporter permease [Kitasatospora sp. NPDC088346]|uniref:branched-chain amino acid ABC transporter permease n=1 Tax=Kitasatospora sp. NPDC088346 TaxID=3364073 RepID=UPI0037FE4AAA